MVNTGANTNGSQFMIIYDEDSVLAPAYSIVGRVTEGLKIVQDVAKGGAVDQSGRPTEEGKPKIALTIKQLYLGAAPASPPTASPSPTTTPSASST
jgi:peptidyl-prolyl cis-trans isomerase B (cyclophilin B)